jgi:hypothetical protein
MGRRINDGDKTGMKQDRFRNSRFEYDRDERDETRFGGVSSKTPNTLGGPFAENRGRRSADDQSSGRWDNSPFENGKLYNWNKRQGWDNYYQDNNTRGFRNHGGAQIGHDSEGHRGKGPKGYRRPDDSIYHDVCDRLSLSPDIDATHVEVSVKNGIVFLNGKVSDRRAKKIAELEVENISGVSDVNKLLSFDMKNKYIH